MTLEEAIQQAVNLGHEDPLEIAKKILADNDRDWLVSELSGLAEDIVAEMARHIVGHRRRGAEIALRPGETRTQQEIKIASFWVPGFGYKKGGDVTPDDLRLRARMYDTLVFAAVRRAEWCRDLAGRMDAEGVGKLRHYKGEIPALPDESEVGLLGAVAV